MTEVLEELSMEELLAIREIIKLIFFNDFLINPHFSLWTVQLYFVTLVKKIVGKKKYF